MGIVEGLFAGRAGIASHGSAISVLADNIANSNTVGFKGSRADFSDVIAGSGGGGAQAGSGSATQRVTQVFIQGTLEFTGRGLDLGIDGPGFFIVSDGGARFYSRAGNFQISPDGVLLNQNGFEVLGFPASGSGGLEPLNVNSVSQSANDTGNVTIAGNVDATSDVLPGGVADIPAGPGTTFADLNGAAAFSTFVDVFDSLGAAHTVTVYFFHTGAGEWTVNAYVDAGEVGGTAGEPQQIGASATIDFDTDGSRVTPFTLPDITAAPAWSNGSAVGDIDFNFDPFTQFASSSNTQSITQDGEGTGQVASLSIEKDGRVRALLDNGQSVDIGTIALASFANPEGLRRIGGSLYVDSIDSGAPVVGRPDSGQLGTLQSGALELSSADIAGDFIKLISLQRGFQGSSRVIGTIDNLMNEIVNLGR